MAAARSRRRATIAASTHSGNAPQTWALNKIRRLATALRSTIQP
jgi:hypothetical protein